MDRITNSVDFCVLFSPLNYMQTLPKPFCLGLLPLHEKHEVPLQGELHVAHNNYSKPLRLDLMLSWARLGLGRDQQWDCRMCAVRSLFFRNHALDPSARMRSTVRRSKIQSASGRLRARPGASLWRSAAASVVFPASLPTSSRQPQCDPAIFSVWCTIFPFSPLF